jgi:hypothetical protein
LGSGWVSLLDFCENGIEATGFIRGEKLLDESTEIKTNKIHFV